MTGPQLPQNRACLLTRRKYSTARSSSLSLLLQILFFCLPVLLLSRLTFLLSGSGPRREPPAQLRSHRRVRRPPCNRSPAAPRPHPVRRRRRCGGRIGPCAAREQRVQYESYYIRAQWFDDDRWEFVGRGRYEQQQWQQWAH